MPIYNSPVIGIDFMKISENVVDGNKCYNLQCVANKEK